MYSVARCNDNSKFVTYSLEDKTMRMWQTQSGECTAILSGHSDGVWSVAFSTGVSICTFVPVKQVKLSTFVPDFCTSKSPKLRTFVPDGGKLASGGVDSTVKIWDVGGGQCLLTLCGHRCESEREI